MKEVDEKYTCNLELKGGLNNINYPQKFVKAPNPGRYPCNYAAEKVPVSDKAMKISLGK